MLMLYIIQYQGIIMNNPDEINWKYYLNIKK